MARSSFYAWLVGEQARADRRAADDALAHEITVIHIASRCTYGVPRIHAELRRLSGVLGSCLSELVGELLVGLGELVDAGGQIPCGEGVELLAELMAHSGAEPIPVGP